MATKRILITLAVEITTDRPPQEMADGLARYMESELTTANEDGSFDAAPSVDIVDWEPVR